MSDVEYYIVSLNHTRNRIQLRKRKAARRQIQPFVIFWRPDDSDYCNCIHHAGRYSEERVDGKRHYYDQHFIPDKLSNSSVAIAASIVDKYVEDVPGEGAGAWPAAVDGPGKVVYLHNLRRLISAEARRRRVLAQLAKKSVAAEDAGPLTEAQR